MYHAFEVCGRRYVPRRGVEAGSWPGVSSARGITSNFGPILHRFWDRLQRRIGCKIAYFSHPSLICRPRSLSFLWNFTGKLNVCKNTPCPEKEATVFLHRRRFVIFGMIHPEDSFTCKIFLRKQWLVVCHQPLTSRRSLSLPRRGT